LISEEPITNFTALEMPPKGFPIVQFDMHVAESIGFEKFDILSQRGLGTIDDAVKLIKKIGE
jgi:DNA polymerase III alpha subunit